jgi:hypothetical protein
MLLIASCATPATREERAASLSTSMEELADALARAGMSVPLPARVCEEATEPPSWDEDIGCLAMAGDDVELALRLYARAMIRERLPDAPSSRADALVDAYLAHDDAFAALAASVEKDFDERRMRAPKKPKVDTPKVDKPKDDKAKDDKAKDDKPKDEGSKDGGSKDEGAKDEGAKDEGSKIEPARPDASTVDPSLPPPLSQRVVGTWAFTSGSADVVWSVCSDGTTMTKMADDDSGLTWKGRWSVEDGTPPKMRFSGEGETWETTIESITDDELVLGYAGESTTYKRRSKTAVCE